MKMSDKKNTCAILFSGGTDSTLAAVLQEEYFNEIHLLTFDRLGIASVENSKVNAQMLIDKYGAERIKHIIINIDKIFKHISYENYISNIRKHGLMNLSTCGLCKLSMHIQTISYCNDNSIVDVADGANQGMDMFPAQMKPVIDQMKTLYLKFGITYSNPVFDYEFPDEGSFLSMENANMLMSLPQKNSEKEMKKMTAGRVLYEKGLAPLPNVKGSDYDRKRQPRCFQFILFKTFANKYFLADNTYEEYVDKTVDFFDDKIKVAEEVLNEDKKKILK
jgi:predicted subunit of tRNA(5-methylaminomethyl-2-thiouridylate) methyltransferase